MCSKCTKDDGVSRHTNKGPVGVRLTSAQREARSVSLKQQYRDGRRRSILPAVPWNKGVAWPLAVKQKMSRNRIGKGLGEACSTWKGEAAKYAAKHMWIHHHYGKANRCENPLCVSVQGGTQPARFEWANISKRYIRARFDFLMLCAKCHRNWDLGNIQINLPQCQ